MSRNTANILRRAAFTITELLVVIAIITILIVLAVPAFRSILYSSERALADGQLRAAIATGRDAAIRTESGDGAAVFFAEADGRIRIVPAVQVGTIRDQVMDGMSPVGSEIERDVFVPLPVAEPLYLPRGWSVRGFAPANTIHGSGAENGWYEDLEPGRDNGLWVYPETWYVNDENGAAGASRQTFMVRFEARTGAMKTSDRRTAIVLDPIATDEFRQSGVFQTYRIDQLRLDGQVVQDQAAWVRRVLERPTLADNQRRDLLGDRSTDTVLARPVTEIALYDERQMASSIGARGVNRTTGTLYEPAPQGGPVAGQSPQLDATLFTGAPAQIEIARRIGQWIEGRYEDNGNPVASTARIFTLQRYLGQVQEVTP